MEGSSFFVSRLSLFYFCSSIPRFPSPGSGFQECTECPYLCPCKHAGEPAAEATFLRRSQTDGSQHALLSGSGASSAVHAYGRQCFQSAAGSLSLRPSVPAFGQTLILFCVMHIVHSCCGFQLMESGITSTACLFISGEHSRSPDHFFCPWGAI